MLKRISIPILLGLFILSVSTFAFAGSGFPETAEDYAVLYEMQIYRQYRNNSAEYRRRLKTAEQVIHQYKSSKGVVAEQSAIQWFQAASRSDAAALGAPDLDAYARSATSTPDVSSDDRRGQQERKSAAPSADPSLPTFAPATDMTDDEPWTSSDLEEAFGSIADDLGEFVASDPASNSVVKKSTSPRTAAVASPTQSSSSPDLESVWEDDNSSAATDTLNDLAAVGSTAKEEIMEALPTFSGNDGAKEDPAGGGSADEQWINAFDNQKNEDQPDNKSSDEKDLSAPEELSVEETAANTWSLNDNTGLPSAGALDIPSLGMVPMGILGVNMLTAFVGLFCMVKQLIVAFKHSALLGIVSVLFCGIGGLIIGWIKHKEWGITKTMKLWTGCIVLSMILHFAFGYFVATA